MCACAGEAEKCKYHSPNVTLKETPFAAVSFPLGPSTPARPAAYNEEVSNENSMPPTLSQPVS